MVTDGQHLGQAEVLAASIGAFATSRRRIDFYVFTDAPASPRTRRLDGRRFGSVRVQVHPISNPFADLGEEHGIPASTFLRLLLPDLLPTLDRVVYLDTDVMALADLGALFDLELGDAPVAAAVDLYLRFDFGEDYRIVTAAYDGGVPGYLRTVLGFDAASFPRYVNSGVMLMNLKRLRQTDFPALAIEVAHAHAGQFHWRDQDVINFLLHGQIKPIDPAWNVMVPLLVRDGFGRTSPDEQAMITRQRQAPRLVHYTHFYKPWLQPASLPFAGYWWLFARQTTAADELEAGYRSLLARQDPPAADWRQLPISDAARRIRLRHLRRFVQRFRA